jgi:hypothetical protein
MTMNDNWAVGMLKIPTNEIYDWKYWQKEF